MPSRQVLLLFKFYSVLSSSVQFNKLSFFESNSLIGELFSVSFLSLSARLAGSIWNSVDALSLTLKIRNVLDELVEWQEEKPNLELFFVRLLILTNLTISNLLIAVFELFFWLITTCFYNSRCDFTDCLSNSSWVALEVFLLKSLFKSLPLEVLLRKFLFGGFSGRENLSTLYSETLVKSRHSLRMRTLVHHPAAVF